MDEIFLKEYKCQYYHDFYYDFKDSDGVWVTKKTVTSEEEAMAWEEEDPSEERRYFEVRMSDLNIMKHQLKCLENNEPSKLPKDFLIDTYTRLIKRLENDWRFVIYKQKIPQNLPEKNRPLLLLIKKDSGRFFYKAIIFNDWTKDIFEKNHVFAWKYIQRPFYISNEDFSKSYPYYIYEGMFDTLCEIDLSDMQK